MKKSTQFTRNFLEIENSTFAKKKGKMAPLHGNKSRWNYNRNINKKIIKCEFACSPCISSADTNGRLCFGKISKIIRSERGKYVNL